jgi:WD40 repeat protein
MNANGKAADHGFYVTGGTLRRDAPSYVERQADRTLYEGLLQAKFCYALTVRQMGKSSLMVRTAARLREEGVGVAVLDLTAVGHNLTAEQWYDGLLVSIGRQLRIEDQIEEFWLNHPRLGPLQRWMSAITEVVLPHYPGRLVIFVDEIDVVRSLAFSTDEFFAGIREFYNRRTEEPELERLIFCLLGVATPSDLICDTRLTPFNIGQRIELNDFTEAEAAPLAQGLQKTPKIGAILLERVFYWTGGHPYLTQRLCQEVVEEAREDTPAEVDRLCQELFLSHNAQWRDDNLLFVRERMLRSEVDLTGLLSLYAQVRRGNRVRDDVTDPLIGVLRLSGVARARGGYLVVRNRIYERVFDREWVKTNMPDAELRRQRAAYRRGLLRATGVAALILILLSGLSLYAFRQRDRADQYAREQGLTLGRLQSALAEAKRQEGAAIEQRSLAEEQNQIAANQRTVAEQQRLVAELQRAEAQTQRDRAVWQEQANRRLLYAAHMNLAQQAWESADVGRVEELLASHRPHPGDEDLRGFEWYYLWRLSHRFLSILRHNDAVQSVAFSPDGKRLATGSWDRTVKLWDAATGQELLTLKGDLGWVNSVAFSTDGKRLATGSSDGTVRLWDASTGQKLLTIIGHSNQVNSVAFSADGKRLAIGGNDPTVKLWDAATGRELLALIGHSAWVTSVAFSPDGKRLATGSDDRTVKLWDAATGQQLLTLIGHSAMVWSVAFSPDGMRLATGSEDRTVKLWDAYTGQQLTLKGHSSEVRSVAFSPDGKRLATGSDDGTVKLWDAAIGREMLIFISQLSTAVAFSPDGKRLAIGGNDRTVKLLDPSTGQELLTIKGHSNTVALMAFSPDGKRLVTGSPDRTVKLWDAATGQELLTLKGDLGWLNSVAFSPDGKRLAIGGLDRTVKLWDAATGRESLTLKGDSNGVTSVAFSPDGKRLVTWGGNPTVRLWDAATGHQLLTIIGHSGAVRSVAFSPDGKRLATGSDDRTVKLWNAATGQELLTIKGHSKGVASVAFSPDGKRLATGSADRTVKLWDAANSQELLTIGRHAAVASVAFSPDGKRLVIGGNDGRVMLWDAATE